MSEFDIIKHFERQQEWSSKTFGPGKRTEGVLDHIRKELKEIEETPDDLEEWIDLLKLVLDGIWRHGFTAEEMIEGLKYKQSKNEKREWPDWRKQDPNKAIEHIEA